jgi:hypothetical protein
MDENGMQGQVFLSNITHVSYSCKVNAQSFSGALKEGGFEPYLKFIGASHKSTAYFLKDSQII